jgi:hypothetical protein
VWLVVVAVGPVIWEPLHFHWALPVLSNVVIEEFESKYPPDVGVRVVTVPVVLKVVV